MINPIIFDCASTFLYVVPTVRKNKPPKKERKVEAVSAVYTGDSFYSLKKEEVSHNHIDIRI